MAGRQVPIIAGPPEYCAPRGSKGDAMSRWQWLTVVVVTAVVLGGVGGYVLVAPRGQVPVPTEDVVLVHADEISDRAAYSEVENGPIDHS